MQDDYSIPFPLVPLLLAAVTVVVVPGLVVAAVVAVVRSRGRGRAWWRASARLAAAAALACYCWGALHLFVDESDAALACQRELGAERYLDVRGYSWSFAPLGFGCVMDDGAVVEARVPASVNPTVLGLGAVALAAGAAGRSTRPDGAPAVTR